MKKLVLFIIMTVFAFSVFAQTDIVEGDSLIIYGGGNFEAEVQGVEATDLNSFPILQQLNDTVAKYTFVQPVDSITFNPNIPDPSVSSALYTIKSDTLTKLFAIRFGDPFSGITYMNTTINIPFVNTTGDTITKGMPLSGKSLDFSKGRGLPDANITNCTDIGLAQTFAGLAKTDVLPGAVGQVVKFNFLVGINTASWSEGDILYVDCDSTITNVIPEPPNYKIIVGRVILVGVSGIIEVIAQPFTGSDTDINLQGILNGIITQKQAIRDTVIGGTVYFETYNEEDPTVDLPFMSSKTSYLLNTTTNTGTNGYARVALVLGTSTQSQINYVYIDNSGAEPVLAVSTTQFPTAGIELAEINVFDVSTHQAQGFGSIQRFNNAINGTEADGWVSKSAKRTRENGGRYESGSDGTFEIVTSVGLDSLKYSVTSGEAWQFNLQTINSTGREKYLWLNSPTGEEWIDDLHDIDVDANGGTLRSNNVVYGLNLFYIINSGDFSGHIAVVAPNGSYNNDDAAAIQDDNSFAITTVPDKYHKVAFRHARVVVRYTTTSGGTFVNPIGAGEFQNERGQPLGSGGVGGGIGSAQTVFSDADFAIRNNADNTKEMQFDASSITTGTTKTLEIPDADGIITLGSGSSTDNTIPRWDGTDGYQLQNSGLVVDDSDNLSSVNTIILDTITTPSYAQGMLFYDKDDDELSFYDSQADSKLNIGSERRIKVRNVSGSPIPDFSPVYQTGAVGNRATIDLAKADSESTSRVIAVTTNLVADVSDAAATTGGTVNGVDTDGSPYGEVWVAKDEIFLSATTEGWFTNVAPTGNNIVVSVGYVLTASNTGSFEVNVNGANVRGAASSIDNNIVRWDGTSGRRIQEANASIDDSGNITAPNLSGTNTGDVTLNASATTGGMSIASQEISNRAATNAQTGYATATHISNIETNNAKVTNVTTDLSYAASTGTINSSDGTNATVGNFGTANTDYGFVVGSNSVGATYYLDGSGVWSVPPGGGDVSFSDTVSIIATKYDIDTTNVAVALNTAKETNVTTDLSYTTSTGTVNSSDGTNTTIGLFGTVNTDYGFVQGSNSVGASYFLNGSGGWAIPTGTGAPTDATYITQIANGTLTNEQALGGLATGILKNTTTTGVLSIAVAGDFPTLNQNTTGSAATLTTPRGIYGNNFDGSADLTQIITSQYGGTGNGFTKFSGATTSEKTYTLPDASTTILTTNAAVTETQGGTNQTTYTTGDILYASGANTLTKLAAGTEDYVLTMGASIPAWELTSVSASFDISVNQASHGLSVDDAIYLNGSTFAKGLADAAATSGVVGVVTDSTDANNFIYTFGGEISGTYTDGTAYFLSTAVAGAIVIEPTYSINEIRQYIGMGTPTGLLLEISEGEEISEFSAGDTVSISDITPLLVDSNQNVTNGYVTPNYLDSVITSIDTLTIPFYLSGIGSDLTVGTFKDFYSFSYAVTIVKVRAFVNTAPTGSGITCDVNEDGTTILSTKITIDATEDDSDDAATPPVISDSSIAAYAKLSVDVDAIGSTIAGASGILEIEFIK